MKFSLGQRGHHRAKEGRVPRMPGRESIFDVAARLSPLEHDIIAKARLAGDLELLRLQSRRWDRVMKGKN